MPKKAKKRGKKAKTIKTIQVKEIKKQKKRQEQEFKFKTQNIKKAVYDKKGQIKYYDISESSADESMSQEQDSNDIEEIEEKEPDPNFENFEDISHKYVDQEMGQRQNYHIYYDNQRLFDCLLNQTSMVSGENHNKFYIIQLLESNSSPKNYLLFCRWGRVGVPGQQLIMKTQSLNHGVVEFDRKFYEKTVKGDYVNLERNYDIKERQKESQQVQYEQSKLDRELKDLIKIIFDMRMMDKQMEDQGYDSIKCPLGQLAPKIIRKGYQILNLLSIFITEPEEYDTSFVKLKLQEYSSEFYSYIPHNFGFRVAPVIKTREMIKEKVELLQSIEQINRATYIIENQGMNNFFDECYRNLNVKIRVVQKNEKTYKVISKSINNTHGQTHKNFSLEIDQLFEIEKETDNTSFLDCGNNHLLFHGSRMSNFVGILSTGLRIAPPQAPPTGYMFGKGIYFADMVSKSANYCCASITNPTGLLLICQVALGKSQERFKADYDAYDLRAGIKSTKGVGKYQPQKLEILDGCKIPTGEVEEFDIKSDLLYNEYIVYDQKQVKLRYLVKLKFNYKQ
ncbi:Poly [ADP-ribose] polymerase 2 [Paramecium bursaria]